MGSILTKATDAQLRTHAALDTAAGLCASALREARRLVTTLSYGAVLEQTIARAYDLFDEIDELLLRLHPARDHEAFVRVARLHRQFEEIQSLIPSARRGA